jgi:hypothetical protein
VVASVQRGSYIRAVTNDFSQGKGANAAPNWKVLGAVPGSAWHSKPAEAFADGIGFAFSKTPTDTKLFLTLLLGGRAGQ